MQFTPRLFDAMSVFDVRDPDELDDDSRVSRRFPAWNNKHRYSLKRRQPRELSPGVLLTRLGARPVGDLLVGCVADRFATKILIADGGLDRICVTTMVAGRMKVEMPSGACAEASPATGLIYCGEGGTRFETSDDNVRLTTWIAVERLNDVLRAMLRDDVRRQVAFPLSVDWSAPAAANLQQLVSYLISGLQMADGPLTHPMALASFTDLFAQTLLLGMPNNYSAQLARARSPSTPRTVRRAEDYLRAHAAESVRMADVASAAGCSLRALQLAFRRFRGTSLSETLQQIRLDAAREELLRDQASVSDVSGRWGFSSRSRFAAAYRHSFGELPSKTKR